MEHADNKRRRFDSDDDTLVYRNELLEEIAKRIEQYAFPFGTDTVASFAALVREMKR